LIATTWRDLGKVEGPIPRTTVTRRANHTSGIHYCLAIAAIHAGLETRLNFAMPVRVARVGATVGQSNPRVISRLMRTEAKRFHPR
jgi:hypothetical protein